MFGTAEWIVFGLIVGVIAKIVMLGRDPGGLIVTMVQGTPARWSGRLLGRLSSYATCSSILPTGYRMSSG